MSHTPAFRKIAAGSAALALTATGAAMLASPAGAASATLNYTCSFPSLGDKPVTAVHSLDVTEVQYGGTVPITTSMTIDADTTQTLYNFAGARQVDGTAGIHGLANGLVRLVVPETVTKTAVPATGPLTVVGHGGQSLAPFASATPAGSTVTVTLTDKKADGTTEEPDIDATLNTYDASGNKTAIPEFPCELADGQNLAVGSVTVVQANTETVSKLTYKAKKDKLIGKSTVTAPDSGAPVVGDVKMVLKRNGKVMSSATKTVNENGIASMSFPNVKNGNYKLVAKYLGDDNFVSSGGTATKSVG